MTPRTHLRGALLILLGAILTITFQYISRSAMEITDVGMSKERQIQTTNLTKSNAVTMAIAARKSQTSTVSTIARTTADILRWNSTRWIEWNNFCSGANKFDSASLRTPAGSLNIFIHDIKVDRWVSGEIKKHGVWERDIMNLIHHYLASDKDLNLLDIGSHIGQFSLLAGKMGRMAVAVDPLQENVLRLCKSIQLNNYNSLVKVFYVALSDSRKKVTFIKDPGNIGGTRVHPVNSSTGTSFNPNIIDTVFLDDLLPLIPFKKAFMKMDVESHENSVLKGGNNFFATLDIPYVLMEWFQHVNNPVSAMEIINFMTLHNYKPYLVNTNSNPLRTNDYKKWPTNVLWKK
ncbi:hypothetical protein SNE40_023262 [Patella caerulea]|uniref:Methyltransferase FkbM domain-containing protein n=3 Tax=Patella caerulea TaxID=87958 RepID=A0AAN8G9U1_PATCE